MRKLAPEWAELKQAIDIVLEDTNKINPDYLESHQHFGALIGCMTGKATKQILYEDGNPISEDDLILLIDLLAIAVCRDEFWPRVAYDFITEHDSRALNRFLSRHKKWVFEVCPCDKETVMSIHFRDNHWEQCKCRIPGRTKSLY